jgi:hypothetical protein
MISPKKERFEKSIVDWEGVKEFNLIAPPPIGRSIFDYCREGITSRLVMGYNVGQIAQELSKAANLPPMAGIKESTLRTWLQRRRISARKVRQDVRNKTGFLAIRREKVVSLGTSNSVSHSNEIWSPTMTPEASAKAKVIADELCADDDD